MQILNVHADSAWCTFKIKWNRFSSQINQFNVSRCPSAESRFLCANKKYFRAESWNTRVCYLVLHCRDLTEILGNLYSHCTPASCQKSGQAPWFFSSFSEILLLSLANWWFFNTALHLIDWLHRWGSRGNLDCIDTSSSKSHAGCWIWICAFVFVFVQPACFGAGCYIEMATSYH